jgi:hypothetical protein
MHSEQNFRSNKDKKTIIPWKVNPDTAIEFVQSFLTTIRSTCIDMFNTPTSHKKSYFNLFYCDF